MKIYLNVHETKSDRFLGIDKLEETDKLTIICKSSSNFHFRLDEVKLLVNTKCCISIVETEDIEETLNSLVRMSTDNNEKTVILNNIDSLNRIIDIL